MNLYLISCILVISSPLLVICPIISTQQFQHTTTTEVNNKTKQKIILYEVISDA